MRAYLVDPQARAVTEIDVADDIQTARKLIAETLDTAIIDRSCRGASVLAIVDDAGLLKGLPSFRFADYQNPLAGKALLLGCDKYGETVDCPLWEPAVRARITWLDGETATAEVRASQAISAVDYRARGFTVETEQNGLVNVITPPERA